MFNFQQAKDEQKGESCPSEQRCDLLAIRDPDETIEDVCTVCRLFPTKPGNTILTETTEDGDTTTRVVPIPLAFEKALQWVNKWNRRVDNGFRFHDLNILSPLQWAAIDGVSVGHDRWQEVLNQRERQERLKNQNKG